MFRSHLAFHFILLVAIAAATLPGCRVWLASPEAQAPAANPPEGGAAEPTWEAHIRPLLAERCASCHSGERPAAGLDLTSWDALVAGSGQGEALIAYDPARSLMVRLAGMLPARLPDGYVWRHSTPYETFRESHALPEPEADLLRRWISQGAPSPAGETPFANSAGRLYVAVQDAGYAAVIDVDRHVVARTADFTVYGGVAATPHDTAHEPDGSAWYVTLINAQRVVKLDGRTNQVVADLDVRAINPTYKPGMLAVDAGGHQLYLSRSISDLSGGRSIMALDRRDMTAEEILVPFTRPHPIGITRDGRYILSGSLADNIVAAIDAETFDVTAPLRVDDTMTPLMHYDVSPDGRLAAITGQFSNRVYVLDISDPENLRLRGAVEVGQEPWYPAFAPDGRRVFVPDHRSNTVSVVDVEALEVVATIAHERFAMPHGAAASPDGRFLFVSNSNLTHAEEETGHPPGHAHHGHHEPAHPITYQPRYPFDRTGDGRADNLQTGHVAVIEATTYEVLRIIELDEFPSGMSLWQEGAYQGAKD